MQQPNSNDKPIPGLANRQSQRLKNESVGWTEIDCDKQIFSLWDQLYGNFDTNDRFSITPCECWDISQLGDHENLSELVCDLNRKCLAALRSCSASNAPWYAFENINHPYYHVEFNEMPDDQFNWPIPIFPNADPCIIVSEDFQTGIIATLRQSITVFGADMVQAINTDPPRMFNKLNPTFGRP